MSSNEQCIDCYCACCGENDRAKLRHFFSVPYQYGKYDFCKDGDCFSKYGKFIYAYKSGRWGGFRKLKYGLPFYVTKHHPDLNSEIQLSCDFCGVVSTSVITNVCMDPAFAHKNFCRNNKCCDRYCKYVHAQRQLALVQRHMLEIPHVFNITIGSDAKKRKEKEE
jgi:hypothetical protein